MMKKILIPKEYRGTFVLMIVTSVMVAASAIFTKQNPIKVLPLFVSMLISYLHTRANRYAILLGALNSILYAVVFIGYGQYASAASCLFYSFPIQLYSFLRWRKRSYQSTTYFKRFSTKLRILIAVGFLLVTGVTAWLLRNQGFVLMLDSAVSISGFCNIIFMTFGMVEYPFFLILTCAQCIVMYSFMSFENLELLSFLIFYVYSLICYTRTAIFVNRTYQIQQQEKKACTQEKA